VAGLLVGETLFRRFGLSRIVGYVLAGAVAGPGVLGWLDRETVALAKPVADAALGLLLLETGRHLDLRWLNANRSLLASALAESGLAFVTIFAFALLAVGLSPGWSAATAAITMASAPAVVLLTAQENRAQGQVTQRTLLLTAISCALSFVVFALVLGVVHAEQAGDWLNAIVHPCGWSAAAPASGWPAPAWPWRSPRGRPRARRPRCSSWSPSRCWPSAWRGCWRCRCSSACS
jgi:Kef-type K+ transport system membrane component KefB